MKNAFNPPDLPWLIAHREAAAEQFRAFLTAFTSAPSAEGLQVLQALWDQLAAQLGGYLPERVPEPESSAALSPADLAELQKTEHRILYLDFLYMLYYLEHREGLETEEHMLKFKEKLQRLHTFLSAF